MGRGQGVNEPEETVSVTDGIRGYIPPTPEQVAHYQANTARFVHAAEQRLQRMVASLDHIGGEKETSIGEGYTVAYAVRDTGVSISIAGDTNSVDMEDQVALSPQAALTLLGWLTQERPMLIKLADESGGAPHIVTGQGDADIPTLTEEDVERRVAMHIVYGQGKPDANGLYRQCPRCSQLRDITVSRANPEIATLLDALTPFLRMCGCKE
jgi:hypothetical protein